MEGKMKLGQVGQGLKAKIFYFFFLFLARNLKAKTLPDKSLAGGRSPLCSTRIQTKTFFI
jgi:hypothetical protein